MKENLLDILACPNCRSPLQLSVFEEMQFKTREVLAGILLCKKCVLSFPVIDGIPRFIPNVFRLHADFLKKYPQISELTVLPTRPEPLRAGKAGTSPMGNRGTISAETAADSTDQFLEIHGSTQERFGFEWMNYPGSLPEDEEIFLAETQIPAREWLNKRVLDAGCGMGRYSRAAHKNGSTVVALDLSGALVRLWDLAKESERLHLVQGNLLSPPFQDKSFDIVFSIGVIHHTPSAKQTFEQLSRLTRAEGLLSLWVYGLAGRFGNFKTNPLRADRQNLKKYIFVVWLIVWIREKISDALRSITIYFPHRFLNLFCFPLALAGSIPFVKYLTFSAHPLWRVRLQENFDWLSPPYQSHHTKEELIQWFEANGFEVLKVLPHGFVPKPGILGKKKK